jgi:hypothetical protein
MPDGGSSAGSDSIVCGACQSCGSVKSTLLGMEITGKIDLLDYMDYLPPY